MSVIRKPKANKLILKTKNRSKNSEKLKCTNCKRNNQVTWRYQNSNKGPADICERCVTPLLKRSFQYEDAMTRAVHSGHYGSRNKRQWY